MPRYTITQQYTTPRPLTDEEQRTLAAVVERAALVYLRHATEPSWRRTARRLADRGRVLLSQAGLRLTSTNYPAVVFDADREPPAA